jgi:hypothetical protein
VASTCVVISYSWQRTEGESRMVEGTSIIDASFPPESQLTNVTVESEEKITSGASAGTKDQGGGREAGCGGSIPN